MSDYSSDLFGNVADSVDVADGHKPVSIGSGHTRRGQAGHYLVLADCLIRGYEAWEVNGIDTDLIARIDGTYRSIQVKATEVIGKSFGRTNGGTNSPYGRTLLSYKNKIDAFAFVLLSRRLVYYCHSNAIADNSLTIADASWSRQACDMSFVELLRRWAAPK